MIIRAIIYDSSLIDAIKAIEMQLPLERLVFGLLEVTGHDVCHKAMRIVYTKGFPMWLPRHNVSVSFFGSIFKQLVELERKGDLADLFCLEEAVSD